MQLRGPLCSLYPKQVVPLAAQGFRRRFLRLQRTCPDALEDCEADALLFSGMRATSADEPNLERAQAQLLPVFLCSFVVKAMVMNHVQEIRR